MRLPVSLFIVRCRDRQTEMRRWRNRGNFEVWSVWGLSFVVGWCSYDTLVQDSSRLPLSITSQVEENVLIICVVIVGSKCLEQYVRAAKYSVRTWKYREISSHESNCSTSGFHGTGAQQKQLSEMEKPDSGWAHF